MQSASAFVGGAAAELELSAFGAHDDDQTGHLLGSVRSTANTKNRDAQRRFRQRQREVVAALEERLRQSEQQLAAVQREKRMIEQHNEMLLKQVHKYEADAAERLRLQEEEEQAREQRAAAGGARGGEDGEEDDEPYRPHLCCLCGSAIVQPQQLQVL
ncbi:hypothetical protein GPECTOR_39g405 [Gonium pectorale]|uniref:BZIP domain-containing protein n=1 Tax=Gonium pectorale TaxID=33097 RepID=A0A150GAN7_GONPE|nr:hypothetical protein GPECTOR_39g405 [Gonium pectorale]|eukprot:KXZ46911.1 hypothetical protein GPECTOR_39g405 [Gonium pectorale]